MTTFVENEPILDMRTVKVDRYGRVSGLHKYRGRFVRIVVLAGNPDVDTPGSSARARASARNHSKP